MIKPLIGIALGVCIGIGCRFFDIPLPGPPAILGAILAVAMATGYTMTDRFLTRSAPSAVPTAVAKPGETQP
jgi:XapX domain-containing protein